MKRCSEGCLCGISEEEVSWRFLDLLESSYSIDEEREIRSIYKSSGK